MLWELFGPDNPAGLKSLLHDVAALLFVLVDHLPLSAESCRAVRGFAAVVSTVVTHLSPRIQYSVEELSKLFLSCLPSSFALPIRDYISTYKTATVAGRYLYRSEAWNLKMTLMILEAFITYSLKRVTELHSMLPPAASHHSAPSYPPPSPTLPTNKQPAPLAASLSYVPALGISAAPSQSSPSSTAVDHKSKQPRTQSTAPHASIPLSPQVATALSQQVNPSRTYANKYTADFLSRAHAWYKANVWSAGLAFSVRPELVYQTQIADPTRYVPFNFKPTDPCCPHCGGIHIGSTAFTLPSLGCVQAVGGGMIYDKNVILLCPNYMHPSASMSPDFPRLRPLPATADYDPSIYQYFEDDKGVLPFAEYIQHAFPAGFPSRHSIALRGSMPYQDKQRARIYASAQGYQS